MSWRAAVLLAALVLGGCQATAETAGKQDEATCLGYGAKIGSDAYVQCRLALTRDRDARRARAWDGISDGLTRMGASMNRPHSPSSVSCTTIQLGSGIASTSCH